MKCIAKDNAAPQTRQKARFLFTESVAKIETKGSKCLCEASHERKLHVVSTHATCRYDSRIAQNRSATRSPENAKLSILDYQALIYKERPSVMKNDAFWSQKRPISEVTKRQGIFVNLPIPLHNTTFTKRKRNTKNSIRRRGKP